MIPKYPVYLFDVDGVLLDSAPDIIGAVRDVLAKTPCGNHLPDLFFHRYIGLHLVELFRDLLPAYTPEQIDALVQDYRAIYPLRRHRLTRVYPGVAEALARLSGRKSTATTKMTYMVRGVLTQFGLIQYFDHVQGTDGFPAKPAPDVLYKSMEVFGARPEDCLLVGDSAADMEAGRRAGVKTCAVRYGYGEESALARWEPDYWISDLRELAD